MPCVFLFFPIFAFPLQVKKWGTEEVAAWLDSVGLGEYKDIFIRHDIQGSELVLLERRDLKVIRGNFYFKF